MSGKALLIVIVVMALLVGIVVAIRHRPTAEGPKDSPGTKGPEGAAKLAELKTTKTESGVEMVLVPAGSFLMGDKDGPDNAKDAHEVKVNAFWMDKQEVSQESFYDQMGINTSKVNSPKNPVERITWFMAVKYCNARSKTDKLRPCYDETTWKCDFDADGYRLPTEAEWEYACRAGTTTSYSFGKGAEALKEHAWFKGNSEAAPHPIGGKAASPWGFLDIHGNVWEWCHDWYQPDYYKSGPAQDPRGPETGKERVLRGGSFTAAPEKCTAAFRMHDNRGTVDMCQGRPDYGFRCVKKASEGK